MILLLALLAALPQDPPAREKTASFSFVRPRGWGRNELQNNTIGLAPPGADAQQCSVFIFPGQAGELNELVFHDRMFQSLTPLCQIDKTSKAYRGSWQFTWAKILNPQKQNQWLILYTTKSGPHLNFVDFPFLAIRGLLTLSNPRLVQPWDRGRPARTRISSADRAQATRI